MSLVEAVGRYLEQGGVVMWPLVLCALVLWYAIGFRVHLLGRGVLRNAEEVGRSVHRGPGIERRLEAALAPVEAGLGRNAALARSVVLIAPLLGLLGTVSGMIELFDSLSSGTFQSQEGGIAAGIAVALFTTELGLMIAIPGFFAARLLERRQARLLTGIAELKTVLSRGGEGARA